MTRKQPRIRIPSVFIGLILTIGVCAFTPYNNVRLQNSPLAGGHFPLASFGCVLFLLFVLNPILTRLRCQWRLHLHEIFLIWSMVTVASGVSYTGLFRTFIINITTPGWLVNTGTPIGKILLPLLPPSLFPHDPQTIRALYNGIEGGWDMSWWQVLAAIPWQAWAAPMLFWSAFIGLVYLTLFGIVGLFSHQWIENEKMNFPLLRVPQILGEESEKGRLGAYVTHKLFLLGFAIPVFLHLMNGLHNYFPQVPSIPTLILMQPYMPKEGFLAGFHKLKIYIYPAFIGFAYLTSKQVSFSLWFFFILGGLLPGMLQVLGWRLPAAALGTTFGPVLSRVEEMQSVGAFGVFFFFIIWLARYHLKQVVMSLLPSGSTTSDSYKGLLAPQVSFYLFLIGFVGTTFWLWLFGMSFVATVLFLGVCFMLQLVTARLICQGGLPYFTLTAAPSDGFLAFLDSRVIGPVTLYMALIVQKVTFVDMRESLIPSLFHASKLSEDSQPRNRFLWAIVVALIVGLAASFVAMLTLYYKYGIATLPDDWAVESARRVHENVARLIQYPEGPKSWSIVFTMIGAAVMIVLVTGYHLFIWWPLHPIGYLTTYSSAMRILWFCFFIGWLCNSLVLRYGGVNQFKEVRRLFVGLVVGDLVMALVWMVVGLYTPLSYHVLPL